MNDSALRNLFDRLKQPQADAAAPAPAPARVAPAPSPFDAARGPAQAAAPAPTPAPGVPEPASASPFASPAAPPPASPVTASPGHTPSPAVAATIAVAVDPFSSAVPAPTPPPQALPQARMAPPLRRSTPRAAAAPAAASEPPAVAPRVATVPATPPATPPAAAVAAVAAPRAQEPAPVVSQPAAQPAAPAAEAAETGQGGSAEKMGERFLRLGLLTEEQVQRVVQLQKAERLRFGQAAVKLGLVSESRVQEVLVEQYQYDVASSARQQTHHFELAIAAAPYSQEAEAIRQLRSEISIRLQDLPKLALAIVSPQDGEGRGYLAASLAIAFAQTGRSTLLVNADLRASGQRDLLGSSDGPGLSAMLAGRAQPGFSRPVAGFPKLAVLDAGPQPPNPAELLREPALDRVLTAYADRFEIFILNTPAAGESADAQSIGRQVDACLMVVRKDVTRMNELEQVTGGLESAGVRLLGTVYNEFEHRPQGVRQWLRKMLRGSARAHR